MSFANQTVTLAKTMEEDTEHFRFQCITCSVEMVEERGEYNCPHCGGIMEEEVEDRGENDDEEEDDEV